MVDNEGTVKYLEAGSPHASRFDITKDTHPLTTFRNNSVKMMQRLKRTWRAIILTVNGKPEAVLQDATAYQGLLNIAALADPEEDFRPGLGGWPTSEPFTNLGTEY